MAFPSLFVFCLSSFSVSSVVLASSVLKRRNDFVQICVLFEALCPDSVRFLLGPLSDAHDEFGERIRLELVPFGKATVNEQNGAIVCQHGKFECQINKFLLQLPIFGTGNPTDWKQVAQDCLLLMDLISDTIIKIRTCADGHEGNALQMAAAKQTNAIMPDKMTFVPWILWNNSSFSDLQEESRADLKPLICKHFEGANIDQCKKGQH
ncbi:hypothetical protein niasHT_005780 [Heterodera trifolii]|uniref:Uncharacterized protein n=1 Tax=Heterodera trifolii TaxID=157864 RepID=A0ABD2LTK4_9BILA